MKFSLIKNAGLNPSIVAHLKSISIDSFSYHYYKLRHPGAIYNLMTSKLIDSISFLCKEIGERRTENIKNGFRLVLYDFFQFYESCYEIILCFCKKEKLPSDRDFLHDWLKKKGYRVGEYFYKSTNTQIKDLRAYYNEIKHSSNEVQLIIFKNVNEITTGYFLDMPHAAYDTSIDPVSLSRELRRIYFLIYFISEKLNEALVLHLREVHKFDLLSSNESLDDNSFKKLNQSIYALSDFYLLNEIGKNVWKSSIEEESILFYEEMINENLVDFYRNGMNLQMFLIHDGYNNNYFVPSCGLQQLGLRMYYQSQTGNLIELPIIPW